MINLRNDHPKITRDEPDGPLRAGLAHVAEQLGEKWGGRAFAMAYRLAEEGLDVVLRMAEEQLGDSDRSIPRTTHAIALQRQRGAFSNEHAHTKGGNTLGM